jgi:hypothetical protein
MATIALTRSFIESPDHASSPTLFLYMYIALTHETIHGSEY